ncbi:MAG: serine/threonine protein kinase, partial [Deltaproteobacteria bacterium]
MTATDETRRYRIERLLGKGGYGRVYKAELIGNVGFRKAVAIKLLHEEGVDEKTLQRFRDEARILGLLNDPAIIKVDPPIRLEGRWAVVMELAEGAPSHVFIKREPMPPGVAAELIGECARALDAAYNQEVDGDPLRLLHRDLKPANVMVTTAGSVKILDFGIAKASFEGREAHTTKDLAGTVPYMAPERLEGEESPAGDVFSLGIMLRRYVRRDKSLGFGRWKDYPNPPPLTEPMQHALQLAALMYQLEPEKRPTMREVEDMCERIRRMDTRSPSLRRWVEPRFPGPDLDEEADTDPLLGVVLTEGTAASARPAPNRMADTGQVLALLSGTADQPPEREVEPSPPPTFQGHVTSLAPSPAPVLKTADEPAPSLPPTVETPAPRGPSGMALFLLGGVGAVLALAAVGLLVVLLSGPSEDPTPTPQPVVAAPTPEPTPVPEPVVEPEPAVDVEPEPVAEPAPEPVVATTTAPRPAPA